MKYRNLPLVVVSLLPSRETTAAPGRVGSGRWFPSCGCVGRCRSASLCRTGGRCVLLLPGLWSWTCEWSLLQQAVSAVLLGLLGPAVYGGSPGVTRFHEAFPLLDVDWCDLQVYLASVLELQPRIIHLLRGCDHPSFVEHGPANGDGADSGASRWWALRRAQARPCWGSCLAIVCWMCRWKLFSLISWAAYDVQISLE